MYTTTKQPRSDTTAHDNSRYGEVFTHYFSRIDFYITNIIINGRY